MTTDKFVFSLSSAQERLWFLEQFEPDSALYIMEDMGIHITGRLDVDALKNSLQQILNRHETLRTNFDSIDGRPVQLVDEFRRVELEIIDLASVDRGRREAEALRIATEIIRRPLDLKNDRLFKPVLLQLSKDEYILFFVMHHIISDGLSINLLLQELGALYSASIKGLHPDLPELPIQYADFAAWQKNWLQGDVLETQLTYWKNQLENIPAVLELPIDHVRKAVPGYRGKRYAFNISQDLVKRLEVLSRKNGVTLYMTLLAALQILLFRYTGQKDILVGSPVAGRNRPETRNLIGLFVNTLILRTDLSSNPTFEVLLKQVRETTLGALENQDVPFEKLVAELQPERNMSHTPFFQVMFALQTFPAYENFDNLEVTPIELHSGRSRFDLALSVLRKQGELQGRLIYDIDLFDDGTIEQFAQHFESLLGRIVENPDQPISAIPILTEEETDRILVEWNDTDLPFPDNACFHELFESRVRTAPEAAALTFNDQNLTYRELNQQANQFAHYLQGMGVGPEVLVGVCLERSIELIISLLGILKAGGAYVPLDPSYPDDRLDFMLTDSKAPILITQDQNQARLPTNNIRVINIEGEWGIISQNSQENLDSGVIFSNLGYVIYTSGSTGLPKGTLLNHRGLVNVAASQQQFFEVRPEDRVLQFSSTSFDAATFEIVMALASGACLCLGEREALMPGPDLQRFLNHQKPSIVVLPPSALQALPEDQYPSLRTITVAGEALPAELVKQWAERRQFFNLYGPTETTIWATFAPCLDGTKKPPIGKPINNTQVFVLDENLQAVPIGVQGALYIGGVGVGRGYLHRPGLTAERFIPNPFGDGDRLYRTGDVAKWLPDGNLDFLGREDHQVKIRGFRIELGEIETVLREHPQVREAVVDVGTDPIGKKRLVAYVVLEYKSEAEIRLLREYLGSRLPGYMVPGVIMLMDNLPLTPSGKVDRKALPIPDHSRSDLAKTYAPPRTPVEKTLVEIWVDVLGVDRVGVHDDFFELGGYSLLVTYLISRIKDEFQIEIRLRDFFTQPTVAATAKRIESANVEELEGHVLTIVPIPRGQKLSLSFAQQRLWFVDRFVSDPSLYNLSGAIKLSGQLDTKTFEKSVNEIIRRHEILRTTFPIDDGGPVQKIAPELHLSIPVLDLSNLPENEREDKYLVLVDDEAKHHFDLEAGPLLRITLIKMGLEEFTCLFSMHHIVSDQWSNDIFLRELAAFYPAYQIGEAIALPDLPFQYVDYAHWQRSWLEGEELKRQLNFWQNKLGNTPSVLNLPLDKPRPPRQTFTGTKQPVIISKSLYQSLNHLSQETGATLFMTLLAAFQTLLFRYTHQAQINIGTPITNRDRTPLTDLIGFFVNTLVMSTDLSGDPSFRQVLERVKRYAFDAYAHRDLPFEMLVDEMNLPRDLSHTPLFQVMFVLQNATPSLPDLPGLSVSEYEVLDSGLSRFDLILTLTENEDGLVGWITYNTALFNDHTISQMIQHLQILLEGIVEDPDQRIGALPLLTESERKQMLVDWNATPRAIGGEASIHKRFEARVLEDPEAAAVAYAGKSLSYGELNRRANQLGRYLQSMGVGLESRVGVCLERSEEVVESILAILKAGGGYLPLDPEYPSERLSYMVRDAQVDVLVTREGLLDKVGGYTGKVVKLDRDRSQFEVLPDDNLESKVKPENLAYVIYTSGSTGKPKGVQLAHWGLVNLVEAQIEAFELKRGSRVLQFAALSFDASVSEIFTTLVSGGTLVMADQRELRDPGRLRERLEGDAIEVVTLPPAMLRVLPEEGLGDLRTIVSAGERCDWEIVQKWGAGRRMLNAYGPTEATVGPTYYVSGEKRGDSQSVPIGRPIGNIQTYVLDKNGEPVPVGVAGELYIGGLGVARGYYGKPGLTAERFVPNPYGEGERLYRTGDMVRYLADGNLEFLGRQDEQVKVRGFRIELGEIEKTLNDHPGCEESVVVAREEEGGRSRLVAYVVPVAGSSLNVSEVRAHLSKQLPGYMLPGSFVSLEALPISPSGKVDRKALPEVEEQRLLPEKPFVGPRNELEQQLVDLWKEILNLERLSIHDNFFDLGGDSILGAIFVNRLEKILDHQIYVITLFEAPTIGLLEHYLISHFPEKIQRIWNVAGFPDLDMDVSEGTGFGSSEGEPTYTLPEITPVSRNNSLQLSFAQQRLWFLDQLTPNSPYYNMPGATRIEGLLDIHIFERSINEIVRRHESLRTKFQTVLGTATQIIEPFIRIPILRDDISHLPDYEVETAVLQLARDEARRPFDLSEAPLLRVTLIHIDKNDHVLLLNMHHIISDGWSMGVFIKEIGVIYKAYIAGKPIPLTQLPIQYADYSNWQREWMEGEILENQLRYWINHLENSPGLLELPADRPRPAVQNFRGAHIYFDIPESITQDFLSFSRASGVTLFISLLAAFQTLLFRYTGQSRINVGTPIANRNRQELENLIGFFVNTLVMSSDISGEITFRALLAHVRDVALGAYAHQDVPFEILVDKIDPDRDLSHTPLFQVMFVYQNAPIEAIDLPGLSMQPLTYETGISKFDITLSLQEENGYLKGMLEYSTDLFDRSTIERMIQHLQILLEGIVEDPDQRIGALPLLTESERKQMLVDWNATPRAIAGEASIHKRFEARVLEDPEAAAVAYAGKSLSYGELNRRANQLGRYLQSMGVGLESRVGVCLERSEEVVESILAILKAGGGYLPLDPEYPSERLSYMVRDAQVDVLVTREGLLDKVGGYTGKVVKLDRDRSQFEVLPDDNLESKVKPENLAYVIYTSGSTGKPKGVQLAHWGLVNLVEAQIEAFELKRGSRVLQFAALSFDASVSEIFTTLVSGGTLVMADQRELRDPGRLRERLEGDAIEVVTLPPAMLRVLPEEGLGDLRTIVSAGERCDWEIVQKWGAGRRMLNAYGPTEATVGPTYYVSGEKRGDSQSVPIGRPIGNIQTYVLDKNGEPVPVGVAGELYIGGLGVARGYYGKPGLTAERFVPNPYGEGERLYRTGDMVRYLADGNLEFLGRQDEQVKVRGFRIELGEIEKTLNDHPGCEESVVVAREEEGGRSRLVAYVVPVAGSSLNVSEVRAHLSKQLPGYMLPGSFVSLEALPISPSGKVDRKALPEVEGVRPELAREYVAPRTAEETGLAEIWSAVLGVEKIGVQDNFFELGGNSILSIQIVAQAQAAGMGLTPQQLFQHPTIEGLAAVSEKTTVKIADQGIVTGDVPLTPIQHWFFEQELPEQDYWNQTVMVSVNARMEKIHLESAVDEIQHHHDALRIRFEKDAGNWSARQLGAEGKPAVEWVDLNELGQEEQRKQIEKRAAEYQRSLNISAGPMLRVVYFELGDGKPDRLLLVAHHLVVDGVSWRVMLADLESAYSQLEKGDEVTLPPKTTSFQKWAQKLEAYAETDELGEERAYWESELSKANSSLPVDNLEGRESNKVGTAEQVRLVLDEEKTRALLQEVPPVYNTRIQEVLLTALVEAFSSWTGSQSLLVDMEGHGRVELFPDVDLSRTVGWFTSLYPVVVSKPAENQPGETLKAVKEQLRAIPKEGIGYGILRYLRQAREEASRLEDTPEAEVSFNYLGQMDQVLGSSELIGAAEEDTGLPFSPEGKRSHLLELTALVVENKLRMNWTYSPEVHRHETILKLGQAYETALSDIIAHCQSPEAGGYTPSDFPDVELDPDEIEALLEEIDDTFID